MTPSTTTRVAPQKTESPAAQPAALGKEGEPRPGAGAARGDHAAHKHADADRAAHAGHDHAGGGPFGEKSELIFALLAGVMLISGWLTGRSGTGPAWLPIALYVAAYGFGGYFTVIEAIGNLRARRFEIDTLMLVAAVGAAALGKMGGGGAVVVPV